jgi:hypothetical protein
MPAYSCLKCGVGALFTRLFNFPLLLKGLILDINCASNPMEINIALFFIAIQYYNQLEKDLVHFFFIPTTLK